MRGRRGKGSAGVPADLLVCFPSRAHFALMPKPICSPSRLADAAGKGYRATRGQVSPLFKSKNKSICTEEVIDEPTSPQVTCAGQIKVRTKSRTRRPPAEQKNWIAVVEEIERMHGHQNKKAHRWLDIDSLKKDVMHFVRAFRGLRFNLQCFGSFHGAVDCTTDEENGEKEEKEAESSAESGTVFSKWLMLLEENQRARLESEAEDEGEEEEEEEQSAAPPDSSMPPPNALMLMRSRSAPAKGWLKRREFSGREEEEEEEEEETEKVSSSLREKEIKEKPVPMSYAPDFFRISTDIARETWVSGSVDPLARSRSWRR